MRDTSSGGMRTSPPSADVAWTPVRDGTVGVPVRVLLELLCVTVQLGACHAVLADVLTLAQQAPELGDERLRAALVALADRAVRLLEGEIR